VKPAVYRILKIENGIKTVLGLTFITKGEAEDHLGKLAAKLIFFGVAEVIGTEKVR
jgi:hypothetical protein